MSVLRFPVDCIYEWYCGLDEFYQFAVGFTIAGAVGMKDFRRDDFAPFVEEYLTQRHSVRGTWDGLFRFGRSLIGIFGRSGDAMT